MPAEPRPRARTRPTSDAILARAEALFADRGYAAPSLRDLIAAAGCSTTAFYARFPTKQAVLHTLVDDLLDGLVTAVAERLPGAATLSDGLDVGIGALVDAIGDRRGLVRVALTAEDDATRRLLYARYCALAELLAVAGATNPRVADPSALAWAIVGALELTIRRWAVFDAIADDALAGALVAHARAILPSRRR